MHLMSNIHMNIQGLNCEKPAVTRDVQYMLVFHSSLKILSLFIMYNIACVLCRWLPSGEISFTCTAMNKRIFHLAWLLP